MKLFLQMFSVILLMFTIIAVNSAIQSPASGIPFVAGACGTAFVELFRFYCKQD